MTVLERLRQINAPPPPEDSVTFRLAVLVAVMASVAGLLGQGVGTPLLTLACIGGIPAGFLLSHLARRRDRFWLKVALAAASIAAFGSFLASIRGLQVASDVQVPLAQLFLWVQFLHSLDVPSRRDLLFSLGASIIVVAVAGVFSISFAFAPYLATWAAASVVALVLAHRSELGALPALGPPAGGARSGRSRGIARPLAAVVVAVTVLAGGLLLVVPASAPRHPWSLPARLAQTIAVPLAGALSNPSLGGNDPSRRSTHAGSGAARSRFGYFGFSDVMDTGARGRPDGTLVMRVRASRPDFWRGQTFDTWDGRRWTLTDTRTRTVRGTSPLLLPLGVGDVRGESSGFVQTFYIRRPGPNLIFGAAVPAELYFPVNRVYQLHDGTLRAATDIGHGDVYTVVSRRPDVTAGTLRAADSAAGPGLDERSLLRYTQLPSSTTARVRALAVRVAAGAPTTYDKVVALESWMGAHTRYSLDVPPLPRSADAVDRFLFVDHVGFCEQIGTSLVVMLRSLGVPARLAVGYVPGRRNPFTGLYEVRADDAHAWAEVWFPGVGWQGFDPTARVPLAGEAAGGAAGAGLLSYFGVHLPRAAADAPGILIGALVLVVAAVALAGGPGRVRAWRARRARSWADVQLA
ncbi:MAG: DUF3488 domain-containing protein, partial [Actinobacteria bacterium]